MYSVFIKKGFSKNSKYSLKLFIFLNLLCNKFNKYILFLCKVFSGTFLKVIKQRLTFYLRKKFFLQHSFIFIKKILSLKGYRKRKIFVFLRKFNRLLFRGILFGRFLYSLKCYFGNTFFLLISHLKRKKSLRFVFKLPKFTTVNRHSFFVLYIKNLVGIYNYKMNLFLSLLRHNYT